MEDKPYLPGLERARSCRTSDNSEMSWSTALIAIPLLTIIFWWAYYQWFALRSTKSSSYALAFLAFLMFIAVSMTALWQLFELLKNGFDYCWRTDEHGLTVRSFRQSRFIPWSAVTSAQSVTTDQSRELCIVRSEETEAAVPAYDGKLMASIWQHLRQVGKADEVKLPASAQEFWTPIPESVPHEITWHNPNPPPMWVPWAKIIMLLGLCTAAGIYVSSEEPLIWALLLPFMVLNGLLTEYSMRKVSRMTIRDSGFEANTAFGVVAVSWDRVKAVSFALDDLRLPVRRIGTLVIPCASNDELIMAIVRRLRSLEKPLLVPLPEQYVHAYDKMKA